MVGCWQLPTFLSYVDCEWNRQSLIISVSEIVVNLYIAQLHLCCDQLAKAAFQASKDPLDAAVFYLAMKKKSLLWGLFRLVSTNLYSDFRYA